jgi:hypothetical protein
MFRDVELALIASYFSYGAFVDHKVLWALAGANAPWPGLVTPIPAELRKFTERVVTCAVPKSQQVHGVKQSVLQYVAHWFIGVTNAIQAQGNARVKPAVLWRSTDLMEVVPGTFWSRHTDQYAVVQSNEVFADAKLSRQTAVSV